MFDSFGYLNASHQGPAMSSSFFSADHIEFFRNEQTKQGRPADAGKCMRDRLHVVEVPEVQCAAKPNALRVAIERGADSGGGIPAKSVFAAVRTRIAQLGAPRSAQP